MIYIYKYLAYLADIFEKLNLLNKSLQGKDITLILVKDMLCAFKF